MDISALAGDIKFLDLSRKPTITEKEQAFFRYYNLNVEERHEDVTHYFGHFPSGRYEIVAHYFVKKNANKTCFIVHGYYDHAGLYSHMINHCIENNSSVVIYDLPGHGLSTGKRASIGEFSDYQDVLKDVIAVFSEHAVKPWCAIGQSTGSAILMDYLLTEKKDTFSKTVLLAPLVRPKRWKTSLMMYELTKYFVDRVPRNFAKNSNDDSFLEFLKGKDPLQEKHLSLRWVRALKQWIKYFDELGISDQSPLIIQGMHDHTVDWVYNIPVIKNKFPLAKVFYLKEGCHQLVNESQEIRLKMFSAIDMYFDASI